MHPSKLALVVGVSWLTSVSLCGVSPAAAPKEGTFSGRTSQVEPDTRQRLIAKVTVGKCRKPLPRVTNMAVKNRRSCLRRVRFEFAAPCSDGLTYRAVAHRAPYAQRISRKGSWRIKAVNHRSIGRRLGDIRSAFASFDAAGKFIKPNVVKGTLRVKVRIVLNGGTGQAITCDSGAVTFRAER